MPHLLALMSVPLTPRSSSSTAVELLQLPVAKNGKSDKTQ